MKGDSCMTETELEKKENDTQMMDITSEIEEAASYLSYNNPLLCISSDDAHNLALEARPSSASQRTTAKFNLQDSMAALELMDPTMDCCEIPASFYTFPPSSFQDNDSHKSKLISSSSSQLSTSLKSSLTVEQSEKTVPPRIAPKCLDDFPSLPWNDLTLRSARLICLEVLTRLESMLSGSSVAESTYTCLYAHDGVLEDMRRRLQIKSEDGKSQVASKSTGTSVDEENNDELKAAQWSIYSATSMLVKMCDGARRIVQAADIYEEEDFAPGSFSFGFFVMQDEKELVETLETSIGILEKLHANANVDMETERENTEKNDIQILKLILMFILDLFCCSSSLAKLTKDNVVTNAKSTQKRVKAGIPTVDKLILLLESNTESKDGKLDDNDKLFLLQTFDATVNRRLLGNAPVRKVSFNKPSKSLKILKSIFTELDWAVCDLLLKGSTLNRIKRMLLHISAMSVNILSRSLIVLNLYFDDLLLGQHMLGVMIARNMQQVGVPETLTCADYALPFLNRLGKPVYDTLKVLALNRNRQRAYIDTIMISEWAALQKEAATVDHFFRQELNLAPNSIVPLIVSNYVLSTTVWLMEHYLGLGIELGLFTGHHDFATAYWYWDFLLSTQLNICTTMRKNKLERQMMMAKILQEEEEKAAAVAAASIARKKKGKKSSNKRGIVQKTTPKVPVLENTEEDVEDNLDFMVLGMRRTLCRGIVRFIASLNQADLLKPPTYKFTTHRERFENRFESFQIIKQPPALTYDDFLRGSDFSEVSQNELLTSTSDCFKASKSALDKILGQIGEIDADYCSIRKDEAMKLAKVCIGNSLFLHKLSCNIQTNDSKSFDVKFDFVAHQQFCSIQLR